MHVIEVLKVGFVHEIVVVIDSTSLLDPLRTLDELGSVYICSHPEV